LNALRTLFGARAAQRIFKAHRGRASLILEEARAVYGEGWDLIRAVRELTEQAFLERSSETILDAPARVVSFLKHRFAGLSYEVFSVIFVDSQNHVVAYEDLFRGTLTQTSVYPREVCVRALEYRAAACVFAHNHPSRIAEPSRADEALTRALQQALALIDVRVLDHIVIGGDSHVSFAERGLL
jgi:DNA repair protein RadC